jgi:hypothetical protein
MNEVISAEMEMWTLQLLIEIIIAPCRLKLNIS